MSRFRYEKLTGRGGLSLLAGIAMAACFITIMRLPSLKGPEVVWFITYFLLAASAYAVAVVFLDRDRLSLKTIWGFAILFRILMVSTSPSLSDDVYRYIWDGNLLISGVNPYQLPVDSPTFDAYSIPMRDLVNHSWMASPYLPAAQLFFGTVYRVSPGNVKAFQIAALIFDLLVGWLVMDMLKMLKLPGSRVLIYLWNPLVIVEFAHGAHVDALMLFLIMGGLWLLVKAGLDSKNEWILTWGSVLALVGALLTKVVPILLIPLLVRRWGWQKLLVFCGLTVVLCALFAIEAGWGLSGTLDGTGIFGALRIYMSQWNYNGGLYHWLEVALTGYNTPGAVPPEVVDPNRILLAKWIMTALLGAATLMVGWSAWRWDKKQDGFIARNLSTLRHAAALFAAYLLFSVTIHPWYVTIIVPFLAFLLPGTGESQAAGRFLWPWLTFSILVILSYSTYIDVNNLREFQVIRLAEYIPLFLLIGWAASPAYHQLLSIFRRRGL